MPSNLWTSRTDRRRFGQLAAAAVFCAPVCSAEVLRIRLANSELKVSSPPLGILGGPAMQRLKVGRIVPFDFHLTLWVDQRLRIHSRAFERFAVSYDLWEETYSVSGLRAPRASASGLDAKETEAWCLDHISMPVANLQPSQMVWMRLDVRAVPAKEAERPFDEATIDLSALIDLLSGSRRRHPDRWSVESAGARVADLLNDRPRAGRRLQP
jgi:hypothetical protein